MLKPPLIWLVYGSYSTKVYDLCTNCVQFPGLTSMIYCGLRISKCTFLVLRILFLFSRFLPIFFGILCVALYFQAYYRRNQDHPLPLFKGFKNISNCKQKHFYLQVEIRLTASRKHSICSQKNTQGKERLKTNKFNNGQLLAILHKKHIWGK